jgi:osmoprotectant transport system permease protein
VNYILDSGNWELADPTSIGRLLIDHLVLTGMSILIALAIAFPLAIVSARYPRVYLPVITVAGILYTLPSLAFMAALIPFTGLTTTTVVIPLVLYAQVVLIRNIVAAIHAVDPGLIDIGRAMGMSGRQLQRYVVLPLALPVIVAGLRIATVTTIGIATIAPLFGVRNLGYLIFQGFNTSYHEQVLAGVIMVSALAIAADLLLLLIQRSLDRGQRAAVAGRA